VDARARIKLEVGASAAVTFAALLASYTAFRPVRDALILDRNPDQIPWIYLGTFVAMSVVSPAWSGILVRRSPRRLVAIVFHVFAACLVGFFLIMRAGVAPVAVGRVFYVWSAVFNLFVISVFWSLLADLLGPGTARQLYGPIAAGGTVGALAGPLLTRLLVATIEPSGVLMISALLLELAVLGVLWVRRTARGLSPEPAAVPVAWVRRTTRDLAPEPRAAPAASDALGGSPFTGIARVARSPYLSAIVGYVLCTSWAATFLYLAQARIVFDSHMDATARTQYFASIDSWTQAITLVLQSVVAGAALRRFGPGIVLLVLPSARAVGLSVVGAWPSLTVLAIAQVIGNAATHGLTRPSRELLFTVVSRDDKYRAKNAIDTIGYRFGDLSASWVNTGLAAIGSGVLALATVPLAAAWLGLAAIVGIGFRRRATEGSTEGSTETHTREPT
jgi:AAA family ATP:ADP antiporter